MILFKQEHVEPIRLGLKTVTRRKGKRRWREGVVHKCYTKMPFTKGGAEPFAHVEIMEVYQQELGLMTGLDADHEGLYTLAEYRRLWEEMYGSWNPDEVVWVVEFELHKDLGGQ